MTDKSTGKVKLAYAAPKLDELGSVHELTLAHPCTPHVGHGHGHGHLPGHHLPIHCSG